MRRCGLMCSALLVIGLLSPGTWARQDGKASRRGPDDAQVSGLADEVHDKGSIVYSAKSDKGDWDLFLMRPDGSNRRNITNTPAFNEAAARFSPDGQKMLYYRMPKAAAVDNNTYGIYELVIATADGTNPVLWGDRYRWASWGPNSQRLACLSVKGIQIVDLSTRTTNRTIARKGIVQQLVWSPDGRWWVGTANGLGPYWTVGRIDAVTGEIDASSETDRYNCTPDWLPDSQQVIYSRGIVPEVGGWAQLWVAAGDGGEQRLLYAEEGRHIYGGCVSPDGKYVLFTRSQQDLGKVDNSLTTMAIIRFQDTPIVGGIGQLPRESRPDTKRGPVLHLPQGWEPHWTYAEIDDRR